MYVGGGRSGYELTARQATARVDGSHLSFVRGVLCARTLAPFMRAVFVQRQPAGNVAQQRTRGACLRLIQHIHDALAQLRAPPPPRVSRKRTHTPPRKPHTSSTIPRSGSDSASP